MLNLGCPYYSMGQEQVLPLVPAPVHWEKRLGSFQINSKTVLIYDPHDTIAKVEASDLIDHIFSCSGILMAKKERSEETVKANTKSDLLGNLIPDSLNYIYLNATTPNLHGKEAYTLDINPSRIEIKAGDGSGLFYGLKSLEQLFPDGGLTNPKAVVRNSILVPSLKVDDYPQFSWRGMHLDVSRHFFSLDFIKKYLDYLSWCKMNVFHWHLTDSQGWRLEIKKYPLLTKIGAFRVQRPGELFSEALPQQPGEVANYGGYYTQDQVREIIKYATKLHIMVVPEIDMPGHSQAAIVAYPEYSSLSGPQIMPSGVKGAYENSFNPGLDSTFTFLKNILKEVMDLFPSPYIHIGGDEVEKNSWRGNILCQKRMHQERLHSENELQSYFIKKIENFISTQGHKTIGWDEILEGGIAQGAIVMSWRGEKGGIHAASENHQVIMAPNNFTYFDLYQGDSKQEPDAYSRLKLTTVYNFDPYPKELNSEQKKLIIGGEGALWTETVPDPSQVEYRLFPRLFALSESLWLNSENKNWDSFKTRLPIYFSLLKSAQINFATSAYNVNDIPIQDTGKARIKLVCSNELNQGKIFYSLDGTNPDLKSPEYTDPILVEGEKVVKLITYLNNQPISRINDEKIETSLSTSKEITVSPSASKSFPIISSFSLNDGIRGTDNPLDGRWEGFTGHEFKALIKLGNQTIIKNFEMDFFYKPSIGIYLPSLLELESSFDGINFIPLAVYTENELNAMKMVNRLKLYREFNPVNARYIRVTAQIPPPGLYDKGHAYILIDEIRVH